jgi:hypothetical protein
MSDSPRRPTRVLQSSEENLKKAYPREVFADFDTGDLTLVKEDGTTTVNIPSEVSVTTTGTGNVITAITKDGHGIKVTKGASALTSHPTVTTKDDTTSNATADYEGSFEVVDSITRDSNGHITTINIKTITMPKDTNTDTLMVQTADTSNANIPILIRGDTSAASGTASQGKYATGVTLNPSTKTITATTFSGTATKASTLATARTIAISGAVTGTATSFNGSKNITIDTTKVDGTKIEGLIPLSSIPAGAKEVLIPVTNSAARLALTVDDAQNGDVIKENDTGLMYFVADETKLGTEAAFEPFKAGTAADVEWVDVSNKPFTSTYDSATNTVTFS